MKKLKKFLSRLWHRILNPSIVQAVSATVLGAAFIAVAIVFTLGDAHSAMATACYALAFLSLVYIVYIFIYGIPRVRRRTVEFAHRYEFTTNLIKNYGYRTLVLSCLSLWLNALYAVYHCGVALHYMALYNALFALYYLLLCALRGSLVSATRNRADVNPSPEERRIRGIRLYISCGVALIVFTLVIVGAIVRIIAGGAGEKHSHFLIYVAALYTFIRFGLAIYNLRKATRHGDFAVRALRNVNFADTLVAMFVLTVSMNLTFGGEGDYLKVFSIISGSVVCTAIVAMGAYMIVSGRLALKKED